MSSKVFSTISAVVSIASLGYILWERKNTKTTIDKIVSDLADGVNDVTVTDEIMQAAAEKAANDTAKKAVKRLENDILEKIEDKLEETRKENEEKIANEYSQKAVDAIDIDAIKQSIEVKASKMVVNKLLNKIDDYSNSIVNKIYSQSF